MRIVISGGGTGGHVYPALAIAEALRELSPNIELLFLGTSDGFEHQAVKKASEEFHAISAGGVVGKGPLDRSLGLMKAAYGVWQAFHLLRRVRPNVVVGTGGYVMAPVLMAANWLKIPTLIQEQNSFPGYATRKFATHAKLVCLGLEDAQQHLRKALTQFTGNPLRKSLVEGASHSSSGKRPRQSVFFVGGSLGAKSLNNAVADCLSELVKIADVTWQFGKSGIPQSLSPTVIQEHEANKVLNCAAFYDDMQNRYANADLIVCRAGAMTLAEIALFGLPAILVPFPFAAHQHQLANARSIEATGAARVMLDGELNGASLLVTIKKLLSSPPELQRMSQAMKALARPNAARDVAQSILRIAQS